jgi:hypothetical protein
MGQRISRRRRQDFLTPPHVAKEVAFSAEEMVADLSRDACLTMVDFGLRAALNLRGYTWSSYARDKRRHPGV